MKWAWKKIQQERIQRRKAKFVKAALFRNRVLVRQCFRQWPIGCAAVKEEDARNHAREDLFSKALQYLEELSSDDDL
jgi:hypothetical protein